MSDFYEDDEPIEDVAQAFDRGEKGVTRKPRRTRVVVVRMTEAEHDAIKARAKRERRTVSTILREQCYGPFVTMTITGSVVGVQTMNTATTGWHFDTAREGTP